MPARHEEGPVVVTGGAGAIGSVLVCSLLGRGARVRVIDNLSSGRREHLASARPADHLSFTVADLRIPSAFADQFDGASAVWHLAANTDIRRGTTDLRVDLEDGTIATVNVLEAARQHDVKRVFFSSSSVVYGSAKLLPTPEEYGPLEPESLYAAGKLAAEGFCSAYAYLYGLKVYLFRFANIIGPGMTHGILYDFFEKLQQDPTRLEVLGDGRQAKSYLRTEDCVDGMLLVGDRVSEKVNLYNLGSEDRITAREIAEKVVAAHGGRARIECTGGPRGWSGDVPQQLLAIDRVKKLGWRPRYSSAAAVDRTIQEMAAVRGIDSSLNGRGRRT
jgi:UDP-glucose 4-epimerase